MINKKKLVNVLTLCAVCIIAAGLSLSVITMPACAEDEVYTNAVRLHVVANSNSQDDQDVKYKVRDEIIENVGEILKDMPNEVSSFDFFKQNSELIKNIAAGTLKKYGYNYGADVNIGIHTYPTRMYETATLPAGEYKSIRVILGEGLGRNWWCVIYPPMCMGIDEMTPEDIDQILLDEDLTEEESLVVKSWILEFFNKDTPQPNEKAKTRLLKWLEKLGGKS